MIKRLLALDGLITVCHFRDDGALISGYGMLNEEQMAGLVGFAHDYKRIVQGNADQLSMFTQIRGWTPPGGWMVRGPEFSICSVGNLVCIVNNQEASINEIMQQLEEASHW